MTPDTHIDRRLWVLVGLATLFGAGHHVDHVVRGNHVGWPLVPEVTAFTASLAVYPLILVGLYLTVYRDGGPGYWAALGAAGAALIGATHFVPGAVEPPADVVEPHASRAVGLAALAWLVALEGTLVALALAAGQQWYRRRA